MQKQGRIKEVYAEDFVREMAKISELIEKYPFISLDTEFPGFLYNSYLENSKSNYPNIKRNVDSMKLIQVGFTLSDEDGKFPEEISTWQFNMKFDLDSDVCTPEAICLLESAGIDFKKFRQRGIEPEVFAEYLFTSGMALNENLTWITFHGIYDFAYILKLLTNLKLPENEDTFLENVEMYFKNFYDIRSMVSELTWLKGSLNKLASYLDVKRVGSSHQAGSDSLVTSKVFFRVLEQFGDQIDLEMERNNVHGLVDEYNESKPTTRTTTTRIMIILKRKPLIIMVLLLLK